MYFLNIFQTEDEYNKSKVLCPNISLTEEDDLLHFKMPSIEFVDLGLPSGTQWMRNNWGAEEETDYGLYFQWGATVAYEGSAAAAHSSWATQPLNGGNSSWTCSTVEENVKKVCSNYVLKDEYDCAYQLSGGMIKLPNLTQASELLNNTTQTYTNVGSKYFRKLISKINGNYILFPYAGLYGDGTSKQMGVECNYYTSAHYGNLDSCDHIGRCRILFASSRISSLQLSNASIRYAFPIKGVKNY
jgi:hypothetical protein